jgi:peptide/nickel transport system substrate-binding protein
VLATLMLASVWLAVAATARGQAEAARTLRIAIPKDYANLSVYTPGASDADPFVGPIYDTLFATPYVEDPQPLLALSAEQTLRNRTWVVRLRDGVTWHDGKPFTARDVVFTFELYRDGPPNRWTHHASQTPNMRRVEALDDLTVRITCAQPCPTLAEITLADLPILPEHVWSKVEDPATHDGSAIGTGPYRVLRRVPGERYELGANNGYFAGRPVADKLVLSIIPEPSSAFLALRSGQVDAVSSPIPPQLVESFESDRGVDVVDATPLSDAELVFNMGRAPFDSAPLRRAVMLAIDKDALLETVLLGRGISGSEGWPHPQSPWTGENPKMPHDPLQARRLIARANLEGAEFEILVPQQDPVVVRATELVVADLRAFGLKPSIRAMDQPTISELTMKGEFDAYVWGATAHALADPTQLIQSFNAASYLGTYESRAVKKLLAAAQRAPTAREFRSLLSRTHRLLAADPPVVPFFYPQQRYAVRPARFDGWQGSPGLGVVHKFSLVAAAGSDGTVATSARASREHHLLISDASPFATAARWRSCWPPALPGCWLAGSYAAAGRPGRRDRRAGSAQGPPGRAQVRPVRAAPGADPGR